MGARWGAVGLLLALLGLFGLFPVVVATVPTCRVLDAPTCGSAPDGSGCPVHSFCDPNALGDGVPGCQCCPLWGPNASATAADAPQCDASLAALCPLCWNLLYDVLSGAYAVLFLLSGGVTAARVWIIRVRRGYGMTGAVGSGGSRRQSLMKQQLGHKDVALGLVAVATGLLATHAVRMRWMLAPDEVTLREARDVAARSADACFVAAYVCILMSAVSLVESIRSNPRQARCARAVFVVMLLLMAGVVALGQMYQLRTSDRELLYAGAFSVAAFCGIPVAMVYTRRLRGIVKQVASFGGWEQSRIESGFRYLRIAVWGAFVIGVCVAALAAVLLVFGFSVATNAPAFLAVWFGLRAVELAAPAHITYVSMQWDSAWMPWLRYLRPSWRCLCCLTCADQSLVANGTENAPLRDKASSFVEVRGASGAPRRRDDRTGATARRALPVGSGLAAQYGLVDSAAAPATDGPSTYGSNDVSSSSLAELMH